MSGNSSAVTSAPALPPKEHLPRTIDMSNELRIIQMGVQTNIELIRQIQSIQFIPNPIQPLEIQPLPPEAKIDIRALLMTALCPRTVDYRPLNLAETPKNPPYPAVLHRTEPNPPRRPTGRSASSNSEHPLIEPSPYTLKHQTHRCTHWIHSANRVILKDSKILQEDPAMTLSLNSKRTPPPPVGERLIIDSQ